MAVSKREKESEVAQSCLTLSGPIDCSPPDSSIHEIFQATVLKWVAISFSRASSWPRDQIQVSCHAGRRFTVWATREALSKSEQKSRWVFFLECPKLLGSFRAQQKAPCPRGLVHAPGQAHLSRAHLGLFPSPCPWASESKRSWLPSFTNWNPFLSLAGQRTLECLLPSLPHPQTPSLSSYPWMLTFHPIKTVLFPIAHFLLKLPFWGVFTFDLQDCPGVSLPVSSELLKQKPPCIRGESGCSGRQWLSP